MLFRICRQKPERGGSRDLSNVAADELKVFRSLGNWLREFRLYPRGTDGHLEAGRSPHGPSRYLIMSGRGAHAMQGRQTNRSSNSSTACRAATRAGWRENALQARISHLFLLGYAWQCRARALHSRSPNS